MTADGGTLLAAAIGAAAALVGVTLTWGLNQVSVALGQRREHRGQLNSVLANLLQIRHLFLVQPKTTDLVGTVVGLLDPAQVQALGPLPPEARELLNRMLSDLLPSPTPVEERLTAAVAELAKADPELSFWLEDQGLPLKLGVGLASLAIAAGAPSNQVAVIQQALVREIGPDLDEAIVRVARRAGGFLGAWRVRQLLKRTPRSEEEVREDLQRMMKAVLHLIQPPPL